MAELLVERGRQVVVVHGDDKPGSELAIVRRWRVLHTLREAGVELCLQTRVLEIKAGHALLANNDGEFQLDYDSVVIAAGARADQSLAQRLAQGHNRVETIGDCDTLGYIEGAIASANALARRL